MLCGKCNSEYRITKLELNHVETSVEKCKVCNHRLITTKKSKTVYKSKLKVRRERHKLTVKSELFPGK